MRYILPDCTFTGERFVSDVCVGIDDAGRIAHLGPAPADTPLETMHNRALMPGFINSHSHVFQRLLRGRAEAQSTATQGNFWTWRKKMYRLVDNMTPDDMEIVARFTFQEMLCAGYTTVKEFHYLHHAPGGAIYSDEHEMALRLESAARDAGISLHLLRVAYPNAQEESQRRFADNSATLAIERTDSLANRLACPVGIAPHSVRAISPDSIVLCAEWAQISGAECHAHVAEQPKEIAWCLEKFGMRPMELLADKGVLSSNFTAVHATHLDDSEIRQAGAAEISTCLCPSTEANLGDGFPQTSELLAAGARLAIGSDSQAEIDPFLECRLLEYHERNRKNVRGVLSPAHLLAQTTESTAIGSPVRLLELKLDHPSIIGVPPEHLANAVVMAGRPSMIDALWMGSKRIQPILNSDNYVAAAKRLL